MRLKGIIENAAFIGAGVLSAFTLAGCGINQPSTKAACPSASSVKSGDIPVVQTTTESGKVVTVTMPAGDLAREFFCHAPYKTIVTFSNSIINDDSDSASSNSTFAQNIGEMAAFLAESKPGVKATVTVISNQMKLESVSAGDGKQQQMEYTNPSIVMSCGQTKTNRLNISCSTKFTTDLSHSDLHVSDARSSSWNYTLKFIDKVLKL